MWLLQPILQRMSGWCFIFLIPVPTYHSAGFVLPPLVLQLSPSYYQSKEGSWPETSSVRFLQRCCLTYRVPLAVCGPRKIPAPASLGLFVKTLDWPALQNEQKLPRTESTNSIAHPSLPVFLTCIISFFLFDFHHRHCWPVWICKGISKGLQDFQLGYQFH